VTEHDPEFAEDLLHGAEEIAQLLCGDRKRRRIDHLVATSNLSVFKLGSMICARKSVLLKWIKDQEERRASASENRKHRARGKNVIENVIRSKT
jgi:hypothetical protein